MLAYVRDSADDNKAKKRLCWWQS